MKLALLLVGTFLSTTAQAQVDAGQVNPDGGGESLRTAVDRDGARRLSSKALSRIKEGSWDDAADLLRRAFDKDPQSAAIATDYGYALAHLGRREEAERLYRSAVQLDPTRFYAYVNLAELWVSDPTRWQRAAEMIALLEKGLKAVEADPRARAHVELHLAAFIKSLGRTAEARARLQPLTGAAMPSQVRQRALQLTQELEAEGRSHALDDWPAPAVTVKDRVRLDEIRLGSDPQAALAAMDVLVAHWPAWVEARWERARVLERLGQFDEASTDLAIVVQLSPSHARAWRHLGMILALHGGRFEAERADEALRHALALEPSWADLRDLRNQVAAKRTRGGQKRPTGRAPEPTEKSRQLLADAQSWIGMDAPEMAPPLLQQALAESPAFVEAAVALYGIEHAIPEATVKALWNDGAGLWQLALQMGALRSREAAAVAKPWIDRAVELGVDEARFARASLLAAAGDRTHALADLRDYVAALPAPPRLEEARALRVNLGAADATDPLERLVHLRLAEDRPADALAAVGGVCRKGLPIGNLVAIGRVHEYGGHARAALGCYQQAIESAPRLSPEILRPVWERLAAAATSLPAVELGHFARTLEAAANAKVGLAHFSLARIAEERRQWPEAEAAVRTFLAQAADDDPRLPDARALQARIGKVVERQVEERNLRTGRIRALAVILACLVLAALFVRRRYRLPLARALRSQPLLFPAMAKAIGQVRHDVLKHRGSALELLADPATDWQDVARALLEPTRASEQVAEIYQHLMQEARGLGVRLRPHNREPVFGPLVRDLARAEMLLARHSVDTETLGGFPNLPAFGLRRRGRGPKARGGGRVGGGSREPGFAIAARDLVALQEIDARLRGEHADRLQDLLRLGPRTPVDAALLSRWIEGVAGEPGTDWTPPQVRCPEKAIAFPLPEATLAAIFSNLLRNAVAATSPSPDAVVEIRVEQGRDGTGRRTLVLAVADSSVQHLDMHTIEQRPSDRGLGIVRETTRSWGGEILVCPENAPLRKAVAVRFPAPPEEKT